MTLKYSCLFLALFSLNMAFGQRPCELTLEGNKLKGNCEHRNFSGFEIELDTTYADLDSAQLFDQLPRIGSLNFKNRVDLPTEFRITERAGFPQILFRFRTTYLTFDDLKFQPQRISFTIDGDPIVPATESDVKIVRLAKQMLGNEKYWNKKDDRICSDDLANKSYSIYCALRIASLEIEDKYNHRNAVLQKLRHKIDAQYPNVKWNHRLMDYNNMEELTYKHIMKLLDEMEEEFMAEIDGRKDR